LLGSISLPNFTTEFVVSTPCYNYRIVTVKIN